MRRRGFVGGVIWSDLTTCSGGERGTGGTYGLALRGHSSEVVFLRRKRGSPMGLVRVCTGEEDVGWNRG